MENTVPKFMIMNIKYNSWWISIKIFGIDLTKYWQCATYTYTMTRNSKHKTRFDFLP
jgi:hypothetical protein